MLLTLDFEHKYTSNALQSALFDHLSYLEVHTLDSLRICGLGMSLGQICGPPTSAGFVKIWLFFNMENRIFEVFFQQQISFCFIKWFDETSIDLVQYRCVCTRFCSDCFIFNLVFSSCICLFKILLWGLSIFYCFVTIEELCERDDFSDTIHYPFIHESVIASDRLFYLQIEDCFLWMCWWDWVLSKCRQFSN